MGEGPTPHSDVDIIQLENAKAYPELAVILDGLLIVFLDIVWEVVHRDVVVLDVLHNLRIVRRLTGSAL
jgi:hypothetical protein